MPCVEETPKEVDVAIRILDVVTPRINFGNDMNTTVMREITQTDHLNKRLLKNFLEHINVTNNDVSTDNNIEEDDNYQDFED